MHIDLSSHDPRAQCESDAPVEVVEARRYCRDLAASHYENFSVASWLLPSHLRQHFANVYAYCRWADDLADETGDPVLSLELLAWWEQQLDDCFEGKPQHAVFVALAETIEEFAIPKQPFLDLLSAFRQDQSKIRYETFDELVDYCRRSANPVGHLVLYMSRVYGEETVTYSDSICTGLQLANFWQDVARDYEMDRIYVPAESQRQFGFVEEDFAGRETNSAFRQMLQLEVTRAEKLLQEGQPLVSLVPPEVRIDIELFLRGGLETLDAIRRQDYDVWRKRPVVTKFAKLRLLLSAWWASRRGGTGQ